MKKVVWIGSLVALALAGTAQAAGDVEAGKAKAGVCAACHGTDGNGSPANKLFPKLAGQHPEYIIKQLHDFKANRRTDTTMAPMAAPLSDQDIENLAAYFGSLERTIGAADPALVAEGEQLYRAGDSVRGVPPCAGCHGPAGHGNGPAKFPAINGQTAEYVVKQLKAFRDGTRTNDPNGMMKGVTFMMNDHQIEAVAQYVQGLH